MQAEQQAVPGLPPPDAAFQQQVLQTMQRMQLELQQHMQQQMRQQLQQELQQQMQQELQQYQQQMQQQLQQYQQQMEQQLQQYQQQTQQQLQQVEIDISRLKTDSRNTRIRMRNANLVCNQAAQWLHNELGALPSHAPVSRMSIHDLPEQQVNLLLDHYGLGQRALNMDT